MSALHTIPTVQHVRDTIANSPTQQGHSRKRPADHIPRPKNAFIIFRSYYYASVVRTRPNTDTTDSNGQNKLSIEAAAVWRDYDKEQRAPFRAVADEDKLDHKRRYPGYVYSPGRTAGSNAQAKSTARQPRSKRSQAAPKIQRSKAHHNKRRQALRTSRASRKSAAYTSSDEDDEDDNDDDDEDNLDVDEDEVKVPSVPCIVIPRSSMPRAAARRALNSFTRYSDDESASSASSPSASRAGSPYMRTRAIPPKRRGAISIPQGSPLLAPSTYARSEVGTVYSSDSEMLCDDDHLPLGSNGKNDNDSFVSIQDPDISTLELSPPSPSSHRQEKETEVPHPRSPHFYLHQIPTLAHEPPLASLDPAAISSKTTTPTHPAWDESMISTLPHGLPTLPTESTYDFASYSLDSYDYAMSKLNLNDHEPKLEENIWTKNHDKSLVNMSLSAAVEREYGTTVQYMDMDDKSLVVGASGIFKDTKVVILPVSTSTHQGGSSSSSSAGSSSRPNTVGYSLTPDSDILTIDAVETTFFEYDNHFLFSSSGFSRAASPSPAQGRSSSALASSEDPVISSSSTVPASANLQAPSESHNFDYSQFRSQSLETLESTLGEIVLGPETDLMDPGMDWVTF